MYLLLKSGYMKGYVFLCIYVRKQFWVTKLTLRFIAKKTTKKMGPGKRLKWKRGTWKVNG
jgi:hypothetical protein